MEAAGWRRRGRLGGGASAGVCVGKAALASKALHAATCVV